MFTTVKSAWRSLTGQPCTIDEFINKCQQLGFSRVTIKLWCDAYSGGFTDIGAGDKTHYGATLVANKVNFHMSHRISREWTFKPRGASLIATLDCFREIAVVADSLTKSGFQVSIRDTRGEVSTVDQVMRLLLEYETNVPKALEHNGITENQARRDVRVLQAVPLFS